MSKDDILQELKKKKESKLKQDIVFSINNKIESDTKDISKQIEVVEDNLKTLIDNKEIKANQKIDKYAELLKELKIKSIEVSNLPTEIKVNNFPEVEIKKSWLSKRMEGVEEYLEVLIKAVLSLKDNIFKVDISKHEKKENALSVKVINPVGGGGMIDFSNIIAVLEEIRDGQGESGSTDTDPLIKYKSADRDIEGATKYLGYTDVDGNWVIRKDTITAVRYASGTSGYTTNWTGRTGLSYDYLYNITL